MKRSKKKNFLKIFLLGIGLVLLFGIAFLLRLKFGSRERLVIRNSASSLYDWYQTEGDKGTVFDSQGIKKVLTFAVIGDIHIGAYPDDIYFFKKALAEVKEKDVDFIVLIGDLTQAGKREEYSVLKKILDQSELKYFVVPGNHDIGGEAIDSGLDNYQEFFGNPQKEIIITLKNSNEKEAKVKKAHLFLLNTAQQIGERRYFNLSQWLWLEKVFFEKKFDLEELRLVFTTTPINEMSRSDYDSLYEFLCRTFIDVVFEADLHVTERFLSDCSKTPYSERKKDVYHKFITVRAGALFNPQKELPGFLVVHFFDNHYLELERVIVGSSSSE